MSAAMSYWRLGAGAMLALVSVSAAWAQPPEAVATRDFVQAAAQSDHFEILEAQTALAQTRDPRVRAFAQQMIPAHMATSQALQRATGKAGLEPPPEGLSGDQQKMLTALQSQRGVAFDRTYAKQQAIAHQQALIVEQGYAAHGANADVRQAARSAIPVIERHLQMAKQLKSQFGEG